mgnify:FL=1
MDIWHGVFGQQKVKSILAGFTKTGKIPHAMLFTGESGVGKDYIALRFISLLNALTDTLDTQPKPVSFAAPFVKYIVAYPTLKEEAKSDSDLPNSTKNEKIHKQFQEQIKEKNGNPYHKIRMDNAKEIRLFQIKEITQFLSLHYQEYPYKLVLISDADKMNEPAQNALLKNLEEPPEGFIFILTSSAPMLLRETIRSRCWHLPFEPLTDDDISTILQEYFDISEDQAQIITPFAGGSISKALDLSQIDIENEIEASIDFIRNSMARKFYQAQKIADPLISEFSKNKANSFKLDLFVQLIITWLRDCEAYRSSGNAFLILKGHSQSFEKFNAKYGSADLISASEKIEMIKYRLSENNLNTSNVFSSIMMILAGVLEPKIAKVLNYNL